MGDIETASFRSGSDGGTLQVGRVRGRSATRRDGRHSARSDHET